MTRTNPASDFVRDAVREKATRELATLNQRADAFGGVDRARDALFTVAGDLAATAGAIAAVATDANVSTRLRKLRKLVDDAHALATELADALGTDAQRSALETSRQSILDALKSAGIDPEALSSGGDAQ